MSITLYNTLTRRKQRLAPLDPQNVRMYVCGPTVYDDAHIGNARPIIVFDLLFRLLRHAYGPDHVTYARNITDVDDKINARAAELGISIGELTQNTTARFHSDIAKLGVLPPTVEPRATDHIPQMRALCETLVANGHAYVADDHVLFDVAAMADYGDLSNRSLEEMEAGARVEVAPYKKGPMDFVLWKPSKQGEPAWPSPCGIDTPGRPGWHLECSAMSEVHLGRTFDIHGGGIDLVFPHHENEIAQSRCAHGAPFMAQIWMHNGFLQVEGEKMSKSLGNFITINELLETDKFGGQPWHGRVIRLAMLSTHYRQPIDWTAERLINARTALADFAVIVHDVDPAQTPNAEVMAALADDLNTPSALSILHGLAKSARRGDRQRAAQLKATLQLLGLSDNETVDDLFVGTTAPSIATEQIERLIAARLSARKAKDYKQADHIRDTLAAQGIQLKDAKDPGSGEIITTWEIRR